MTEKIRIAMLAITKHAANQVKAAGLKMPDADIIVSEKFAHVMEGMPNNVIVSSGPLRPQIGNIFSSYDQLAFFVSLGAVVRLIAPHLKSKEEDPGVVVVDDAARFVIPVLSGHVGGANAFAEQLADLLGATAVLTTASDASKTIAVDILGRELGWKVEAPKINITRVSANVVNEETIALVQECGAKNWWTRATPIPKNIHLFEHFNQVDLDQYKSVLLITQREIPAEIWQQLDERLVVYRPPKG
ncbi:Cobalt-precorrin 5A hydrolase [hydrothermal vent metagenome]|uniref:Cobalt-precorrin 5A hydrolase n=1 Tax=hydrothermal vent metagenome TaxID=652676 RepID=A0A3B1B6R2_9ZZZZ